MADELLVEEEAAQIGMALEAYAEHVPDLAFEPVGDWPEGTGGRQRGVVLLHPRLQAEAMIVDRRVEMIDDREPRPVLSARELEIVHGRDVGEQVECQRGIITAEPEGVADCFSRKHRGVIAPEIVRFLYAVTETFSEP